ncbi:T3SS effector HopA1 family protein [Streptosporangium sp. NPDC051023]|uniref:T3SS effector HopA1 family protein n=1 Tax=Streptosporangium sp. NPDC051023 TaxID=3155410 RepID=UPI00344D0449
MRSPDDARTALDPPTHFLEPDVLAALDRLAALVEPLDGEFARVAGTTVCLTSDDARERLADELYRGWYTASPSGVQPLLSPRWDGDLTSLLRAAHAGAELFDPGWTVVSAAPGGHCHVSKNGHGRSVQPGEYVSPLRPGAPPAPGERVDVVRRHDWTDEETGFWCAQFLEEAPEAPFGRAYLNVAPGTVAPVLRAVTEALERDALPYSLKCPASAEAYDRVDSLVLYHGRDHEDRILALLTEVHGTIGSLLGPPVPPLTRRVAPGMAQAHDPKDGGSFGQSRCRALAGGLLNALRGNTDRPRILASLVEGLHAAGIDPRTPWRTP